ncbi:MAG: acyl-ACP--UDP-N-acetylglucosamine O-acyltransferase [Wenzhouxiangellaceae bacterium]
MSIHSSAIVDPAAQLDDDVSVGPYSIIGPQVRIGAGTRIGPHVVISGRTTIGRDNRIFQFSSIGDEPQDKKYQGEDTELIIGDGNTIREQCTLNRGTMQGGGVTRIGDDNWLMACVHIAHDCIVGNHTVFANNSALAGHVVVEDWAILSGYSLVHQFCIIGRHSLMSFGSHINRSVPPYVMVSSDKARPRGINTEGLRRRGFNSEQILRLRQAYRILYRSGLSQEEAQQQLEQLAQDGEEIKPLLDFLQRTERGYLQ